MIQNARESTEYVNEMTEKSVMKIHNRLACSSQSILL